MRKTTIIALAAILLSPLLSLSAEAGSCGYTRCWGAVGFGPGGAWGYSHSYKSEWRAKRKVRNECSNCTVIKTFYNTCGAIAAGPNNGWGWGWASTRAAAERTALNYCRQNSRNCFVRAWACSR